MKIPKQSFLDWNNNVLVSSIKKIDLSIILIVILDIIFYLSSGYLFVFWLRRIQAKMAAFNMPSDIVVLNSERIQQLVSDARAFYYLIIFSLILVLLAVIFLASIIKGIIWAKTTKTKLSFHLISKFLALNLIWMSMWFLIIFLISFLVQPQLVVTFMLAALILSFYLTNNLYSIFMKEQTLKSIFSAVKLSIAKIHLFLLPYALILLLFFILLKVISLLKFKYSDVILILIAIVYIAIVRYYASTLVFEVEVKNK